jgi:hypothetical protein
MGAARAHDDFDRYGDVRPPPGVDGQGARAGAGAQPGADGLVVERQRFGRASVTWWVGAGRMQGPVRHADRGKVEHGAEMQRQAGVSWVVAASRVDE